MKRIDFLTSPSGFPLNADTTLHFMQETYSEALKAIAALAGDTNVIVQGCQVSGAGVTPGWLYLNGELVRFQGAAAGAGEFIAVVESHTTDTNEDGTEVPRYFSRIAGFNHNGTIRFSSLIRAGSLVQLQRWASAVIGFEPAVIVSGLQVSNVSGGSTGTLSVSPGTVAIGGRFLAVPAYSGAFPAHIDSAGRWQRNRGGDAGITFDPHTSQYAKDVLARATAKIGEIRDVATYKPSFHPSGLGRWEWKGWAICDGRNGTIDLTGRVRVGYGIDAADDYGSVGKTGGKEKVTLSEAQMPRHNHGSGSGSTLAQGEYGLIRKSKSGENKTVANTDPGASGVEPDVTAPPIPLETAGGGQPHENRMPYRVVLTVQRIEI